MRPTPSDAPPQGFRFPLVPSGAQPHRRAASRVANGPSPPSPVGSVRRPLQASSPAGEIDAALSIRALFATPAQSITAPVTVALDVPASCEPEAVTVPRSNVELSSERISDLTIVAFL